MKFIKIFLASSIVEFQEERQQMGNFVRSLNDTYVRKGIYFELIICEDLSASVALERKQQEYNDIIRSSQYFYIIFGRSAGQYTIEEFYVALEQFKKSGSPRIFTYFKILPEGEKAEQSVLDFMEQLGNQIGHYYSSFTHLDAIKLNLLLELVKNPELDDQMKFEDGQVVLGDRSVLPLKHVPLYNKNDAVQELLKEQERLDGEFGRLAVEYGKHPEDAGLLKQMMELGESRSRVRDSLHRIEMEMLGLYSQVEEKRQAGKKLNWREKKALELVDLGDYEGAKNILRDAQWEKEVGQAEEAASAAVESIREYISGKRSLISTLMVTGPGAEAREEILSIYERCCSLAEKYQIEMDILREYAQFLRKQRAYPQGIRVAERLERYYVQKQETQTREYAVLMGVLGILYGENNEFYKAEQVNRKAVDFYRNMAAENPEYRINLAKCINSLAVVLHHLNQPGEEEALHREAMSIWRALAQEGYSGYEEGQALACDNLAVLLQKKNSMEEAELLYLEALQLRRQIVKRQTDRSDIPSANLARSCHNLANLMFTTNRMEEAEVLYNEALEIRLRLAKNNSAVYGAELARSYHALAAHMCQKNRPEEAEKLYHKALEIRRPLAEANPAAYEPNLAESCEKLAFLYYKVYRLEEAEKLSREALAIYRRLAEENPEAYESYLAESCISLGNIFQAMKRYSEENEGLYREALAIYDRLAEKNPEIYQSNLAGCCNRLALLLQSRGELEEAEKLQRRSLVIREDLASANPETYDLYLADSCNGLANLLNLRGQYEEAEKLYCRALDIRRRLMQVNREAYKTDFARSCHDLAVFYRNKNRMEEAEELYREAWEVYHQLSEAYPASYDVYLSPVSFNLAALLKSMGKTEDAVRFAREAFAADRRMAAANPGIYAEYPAESGCFLAELLYDSDRDEANMLYREVLQIYEKISGREEQVQRIRKILEQ